MQALHAAPATRGEQIALPWLSSSARHAGRRAGPRGATCYMPPELHAASSSLAAAGLCVVAVGDAGEASRSWRARAIVIELTARWA